MTTIDDATLLIDQTVRSSARLSVRLASAELRISAADTDRITVRTRDGRPTHLDIEADREAVTIREKEPIGLVITRGRPTASLDITVPASIEVATDIASGDTETHGLRGSQRHRSASGDLRLFDAAGPIELTTVSGAAVMELAGEADLTVRTVSGNLAVAGGSLAGVRISTTSGDVRLDSPLTGRSGNDIETLSGDASIRISGGVRVDARTVSGDLVTDLPHRSDGRMGRRTLIVGDGRIEVAFRSVSGGLRVLGWESAGSTASRREPDERPTPALRTVPPVPTAPQLPVAPPSPASAGPVAAREDDRMAILRAVERGELDVAAAMTRLAALDRNAPTDEETADA